LLLFIVISDAIHLLAFVNLEAACLRP